jgi:hypothetical protein
MAKNLRLESMDSKAEREMATFVPYSSVSVTVTAARQPIRRPDGGTEAAEPDVETSSKVVPSRELIENASEYDRRVQEFRKQQPDLSRTLATLSINRRTRYLLQPTTRSCACAMDQRSHCS